MSYTTAIALRCEKKIVCFMFHFFFLPSGDCLPLGVPPHEEVLLTNHKKLMLQHLRGKWGNSIVFISNTCTQCIECTDAPARENTNLCVIALKVLFPKGPLNSGIEILPFYFLTLNSVIFFPFFGERCMRELIFRVSTCQTYLASMVALIQCEFKHLQYTE